MIPSPDRELLEMSMLPEGCAIVVACSGGGDSMALLHLVADQAPGRNWHPMVAHLDHGLREDSPEDAAFVMKAAEELGVPSIVESVRLERERRAGESTEAAARRVRYDFLGRVRDKTGPGTRIVTGHTLDDQVETVALRLARGSGIRGLRGILAHREDGVIRPLLHRRRAELRAYLVSRGLGWREDSTNLDRSIPRNRWRGAIEHLDGGRREELYELAAVVTRRAGRLYPLLRRHAEWWLQRPRREETATVSIGGPDQFLEGEILLERPSGGVHLGWSDQALLDAALEAVGVDPREVSRRSRERLLLRAQGEGGAAESGGGLVQLAEDTWSEPVSAGLLLARGCSPHWDRPGTWERELVATDLSEGLPLSIDLPRGGSLRLEPATVDEIEALRSGDADVGAKWRSRAFVDLESVGEGVVIRYPRNGDTIRPFGMEGHKLLSDLFGEAGVPRLRRGRLPVVLAGDEILWVAGVRAAEAGRVGDRTRAAVALAFET